MTLMQKIRLVLKQPMFWAGLITGTTINTVIFYHIFNR